MLPSLTVVCRTSVYGIPCQLRSAVSFKSRILQGSYFLIDSSAKRRNNAQSVTEFSKRDLPNRSFLGGLLLLLSALTFYYFAVLRIDYQKTALLDLGPHPDATEYFAQAKALSKRGWPSIQIGYERLPSRYPPGDRKSVV